MEEVGNCSRQNSQSNSLNPEFVKINFQRIDNDSTTRMLELFPLIKKWIEVENCLHQAARWGDIQFVDRRNLETETPRNKAAIIITENILPKIKVKIVLETNFE